MEPSAGIAYWVDEEGPAGAWPGRVLGDGRQHNIIVCCTAGQARLTLPGLEGTLRPHDLLVLYDRRLSGEILRLSGGGRLLWCAFDRARGPRLPALPDGGTLARPLLERLLAAYRSEGPRGPGTSLWLAALLRLLDENHPQAADSPASRLRLLVAAIDREPWERHAVTDLARRMGCSASAFQRRFRALTGQSPRAYLSRARIACACDLLLHDGASATSIAERLGFHDLQHFSRQFRRSMGCTPAAWRTRAG